MSPELIGFLGIILLLALIAFRMPISFAMLIVGILGFGIIVSPSAAFSMSAGEVYATISSYSLSVIPMFVWMGFIAFYSGVGTNLYRFAYRMIGHRPGGLAIATQAACAMFGAICGSNTATAATMGAIAIPEMKTYNYDDSLSSASVAAGGALGVLIPPSVIFIIYGISSEQSIGKLFIAGIVPGILLMVLYMLTIRILVKRNPSLGPVGPKSTWRERFEALGNGLFEVMITFLISIGGLLLGWFTPTEAGAVGAASILVITLLRKQLNWAGLKKSLMDT
ncbi:MAG TPA: TRAP transporter large permease subunit, partial [Clostridia bacterium]|nr:TRAP transporter large permease subunit [Clostridia bacterium]